MFILKRAASLLLTLFFLLFVAACGSEESSVPPVVKSSEKEILTFHIIDPSVDGTVISSSTNNTVSAVVPLRDFIVLADSGNSGLQQRDC